MNYHYSKKKYYINFSQLNNLNHKPKLETLNEIRTQIIWGNQFIKHNGKCLLFTSWVCSWISFKNELINDIGQIKETL